MLRRPDRTTATGSVADRIEAELASARRVWQQARLDKDGRLEELFARHIDDLLDARHDLGQPEVSVAGHDHG